MELIAQDGEHPALEIRAALELVQVRKAADHGFLNEVVGPVDVTGERDGEGAQMRQCREEVLPDVREDDRVVDLGEKVRHVTPLRPLWMAFR